MITGNTPVTFAVRSMVPSVMSVLVTFPVERTPLASLCTSPAVVNPGRITEFAVPPIVTFSVEVPVLMFVALFEFAFKLTAPPEISAPADPVNKPAEVTVPVPVVEISPVVETASPAVTGDRVVPDLSQYPIVPEDGGVEVYFLLTSV